MGIFAAAAGTALSYIFGHVIGMNYYYRKAFGFHPIRVYRRIFCRTWICILLSSAAAFFYEIYYRRRQRDFLLRSGCFSSWFYAVSLLILPDNEKSAVIKFFKKIRLSTGLRKELKLIIKCLWLHFPLESFAAVFAFKVFTPIFLKGILFAGSYRCWVILRMVNVIGLGYIGLPTAIMLASRGIRVVGTDCSIELVEKLKKEDTIAGERI